MLVSFVHAGKLRAIEADKNLGVVIVSTKWLLAQILGHLLCGYVRAGAETAWNFLDSDTRDLQILVCEAGIHDVVSEAERRFLFSHCDSNKILNCRISVKKHKVPPCQVMSFQVLLNQGLLPMQRACVHVIDSAADIVEVFALCVQSVVRRAILNFYAALGNSCMQTFSPSCSTLCCCTP